MRFPINRRVCLKTEDKKAAGYFINPQLKSSLSPFFAEAIEREKVVLKSVIGGKLIAVCHGCRSYTLWETILMH